MSDHLDRDADDTQARAAVVIGQATPADVPGYRMRYAEDAAQALDRAGLLATPDVIAAAKADALREAVEDAKAIKVHAGGGNLVTVVRALTADALRARADRIEREAGESDADA